jgi:hypothetical protein
MSSIDSKFGCSAQNSNCSSDNTISNPMAAAPLGDLAKLPYEIRRMIYHELEPHVTLKPQYNEKFRKRNAKPVRSDHPILNVSKTINEEIHDSIVSQYHNKDNPNLSPFLPSKTTFCFHTRLQNRHFEKEFFEQNDGKNRFAVQHLQLIINNFEEDPGNISFLRKGFPHLKTLEIVLRYDVDRRTWKEEEHGACSKDIMEKLVKTFFETDGEWKDVPEEMKPEWTVRLEVFCMCGWKDKCTCGLLKAIMAKRWGCAL